MRSRKQMVILNGQVSSNTQKRSRWRLIKCQTICRWQSKIIKEDQPSLKNINNNVACSEKPLDIFLDNRLSFEEHLKIIFSKVNKKIGLLRKFHKILPRSTLLTIYKDFVRPHLKCGLIIFNQAYDATFHQKLELIQYNGWHALTRSIRRTLNKKFYEELGL